MKENRKDSETVYDENGRRDYRRKRRVRNQVIAYIGALVLLAAIVAGADFGIRTLVTLFRDLNQSASANEIDHLQADTPIPDEIHIPDDEDEEESLIEEPVAELSALDIVVENCIAELSIEDKVAGLFFITPEQLTGANPTVRAGDTTREKLLQYPVGGLIYFARNIQSANQLKEMLSNVRDMSKYPIFLAVDEEGGRVARVAGRNLADNIGPMGDIGASGDPDMAKEAGFTIGTYLSEFGFDTNFAPVADVLADEANEILGDRSFGTDPSVVANMAAAFINGAKEAGINSAMKHFPGLGNTSVDTHIGMAVIESTLDEMQVFDFRPFTAGIEAGCEFIMMGHVSVPNIIGDNTPASLSKKMVQDILRDELGFQGIIITDALNMAAVSEYYTSAEACLKALEAGVDMLLMPENFEEAYEGILEAVQSGRITEERLNESLRRIYRVKYAGQVEE